MAPGPVYRMAKSAYHRVRYERAAMAFRRACPGPEHLDKEILQKLHRRFQYNTEVSYDSGALLERGLVRYREMKSMLGDYFNSISCCIEIGCGDGMVASAFAENGIDAVGLDCEDRMFDERALNNGVSFLVSPAESVPVGDGVFDLVFSYNSFEHIGNPEKAFLECMRILKPGGFLYLTFNPLFKAPMGFHAYKSTQVPYLQVMFDDKTIREFIAENNLPDISFSYQALNKWSVTDFRKLWRSTETLYSQIHYREIPDYIGLDLIARYPGCFKASSDSLDDFVVSGIELLVRKELR